MCAMISLEYSESAVWLVDWSDFWTRFRVHWASGEVRNSTAERTNPCSEFTRQDSTHHSAKFRINQHVGLTTYDAKDPDTKFPPIEPLRPPEGAPNVLIVLLDDVGFACLKRLRRARSTRRPPSGSPATACKFNRFHTTALCSPTRQAMLTGRNHHSVNMGSICELATSAPGYTSVLPKDKAPLAMTLKLNGYSTAQFGKCHEVPVWETSPMGPFDQWPTGGGGFEYFYGFIGGETNQFYPAIYEGTTPIEPPKTPEEGYHFTEDMTNKAIKWVRQQKALMPDKPFFMYFAPGACHAPHHVPKEWADKYKGKFDQGWDKLREEIFARQKELGVIPRMPSSPSGPRKSPPGTRCRRSCKPILARQMEIYAALPRAHRPPRRAAGRCAQGPGGARRHAGHLHHRRQWRFRRRDPERQLQ